MDTALLIGRLFFGLGIAAHGAQKLFGWFGGYGLAGTGGAFEQLGFRPGRLFAAAAALGESVGGALVALGLLGPVGPALVLLVTLVATIVVHLKNGFFVTKNGVELPMLYAMGALVLAFTGPGRYALDRVLGLTWLTSERAAVIAVGIAILGALLNVMARRAPPQPQARASAKAA